MTADADRRSGQASTRVLGFIDGFNLYFGLRSMSGHRHKWLDVHALLAGRLRDNEFLLGVHYFTASVQDDPSAEHRQSTYLDALATNDKITVHRGRFQTRTVRCRECGHTYTKYEEKETDVHLGVRLVEAAAEDGYDVAFLVSGDSDLVPAVEAAGRVHPRGRIVNVRPPKRRSAHLARVCHAEMPLRRRDISASQLPDSVSSPNGIELNRPDKWQ